MWIKAAEEQDIARIEELYKVLFAEMANLQPYTYQATHQDRKFIENMINSPQSDFLVVTEDDGYVVGFVLVQEQQTSNFNCLVKHRYTYLIDLVVDPIYRNLGIGSVLIESAKEWSQMRGTEYIELDVLPENEGAVKLYQRQGFEEVIKTFRFRV